MNGRMMALPVAVWCGLASTACAEPGFLEKHCHRCHGDDVAKGYFRLTELDADLTLEKSRARWSEVLEKVRRGEMPPQDEPRPPADETQAFVAAISSRLVAAEAARRAREGRVVLRRLNRVEYENTIRDLFGIEIDLQAQLPPDSAADGFDNAAAAHHTSSFLLEKYLDAADAALNAAIAKRPQPPPVISKRYPIREMHPVKGTTEDVYRHLPDGTTICFCSSEWHNVWVSQLYPNEPGRYRCRIVASAVQNGDKPLTFRVVENGSPLTGASGLVGYFDAPPNEPREFEIVRRIPARRSIAILPYGLAGANTVKQTGGEKWEGPGLALHSIDVEGPLNDVWPPESHRRLFGELAQKKFPEYNNSDRVEVVSEQPREDAERILTAFVGRAFRREVTADDVAPFVRVFIAKQDAGYSFERALRAALKAVLISPQFLFLRESPGKLDDFALASRLSYFLWSTMPDAELLSLARDRRLTQPGELRRQVERLLKDPRVAAFTKHFTGQWLGLREIDATEPSHLLYPEFDHLLKVSMLREAELFFDEVLRNDLSVTNFIHADFALLNGRLAKHYGIGGVDGWEFRRVALPPDSHRGGVLTMAGILKVTANGTTTSPVTRGAWVLDRLLGQPAPPPPANVAALDPDIRGATTIREQLAKHRADPACASCHRQIDPPGFALESFDCIGGYRERYRVTGNGEPVTIDGRRMHYNLGRKVDPADALESGERFAGVDELKQLLLKQKAQVARGLASRLIAYATGRAPQPTDREAVDILVAETADRDYGLRSLIHAVIRSEFFQAK